MSLENLIPDNYIPKRTFYDDIKMDLVPGFKIITKIGAVDLDMTILPITMSGVFQTPTVAESLEFVSDSSDDSSGGIGARKVLVEGLGGDFKKQSELVDTDGLTPVQLTKQYVRVFRFKEIMSGTYAKFQAGGGSHKGTLTIQGTGGGDTWITISQQTIPSGQSLSGIFAGEFGATYYIINRRVYSNSDNKAADFYFLTREEADVVSEPFPGVLEVVEKQVGVSGGFPQTFVLEGPFVGPCDIGYVGTANQGGVTATCKFEVLEILNTES